MFMADRVRETTQTVGTGTITMNGALVGFQSFLDAFGVGGRPYYVIYDPPDWEVGHGTVTGIGTTLTRDTVIASTNSNAAIVLSGNVAEVFCGLPAEWINRHLPHNVPLTTTDATPTVLHLIPILDDTVYTIDLWVTGHRTDVAGRCSFGRRATVWREAGPIAIDGLRTYHTFSSIAGAKATIDTSGTNARVVVTGGVGATIDWEVANVDVQRVG